jgi:predicted amidohydrolase
MPTMKITVCQLPDDRAEFDAAWSALGAHCRHAGSDLVLLPELPFSRWLAADRAFGPDDWRASMAAHQAWLGRLAELGAPAVLATVPVVRGDARLNHGVAWDTAHGLRGVHQKFHLPEEVGYWERTWFSPGDGAFDVASVAGASVGLLICTELWALERAATYGKAGAQVIATPRATDEASFDLWLAAGRVAAAVSGAFSISSNRRSVTLGQGGGGWVVSPDGAVLAVTTDAEPFATVEVDLDATDLTGRRYPRYAVRT